MSLLPFERHLGAHPVAGGEVEFRVWAPEAASVEVELAPGRVPLAQEGYGVWSVRAAAAHGDTYRYVLDGGDGLPDPATRWQPDGLRGPSAVVDPERLVAWTDAHFEAPPFDRAVIYELHVGTFTAAGTFDAAIEHLPGLADLGVTHVEVLPVAEMPGRFGWGYDGVYLGAPQSTYGGPEGFARFVDAAHAAGLAVVLDVVLNHVGASGDQALKAFGPYFTGKYSTFWGGAINYDDSGSGAVREWALQAVTDYVDVLHVDGFRLDAIHAVYDDSAEPVLRVLADRVHARGPGKVVIAESGLNDPKVTRPAAAGGLGHDAAWADDFHHALRTLVTDEREGYYAEFGAVADLAKAYVRPFVHDGTWSEFRGRRFGAPAFDRAPSEFVVFCQDHDQVGNRALGDRLPAAARRIAAFAYLLSPFTPMLFMGEEHGEDAPFQFFADHIDEELATATREGRRREFASFSGFAEEDIPDPGDPATFERSKLTRRGDDPGLRDLYRDLIALRPTLPPDDARCVADEDERWLRVARGSYRLCLLFAHDAPGLVALDAPGELVLATHPEETTVGRDGVSLPPLGAALVRVV